MLLFKRFFSTEKKERKTVITYQHSKPKKDIGQKKRRMASQMFQIFAFMLLTLLPFLVFSETSAHFYHNYDDISVTLETSPGLKTLKHHRMRHGHGHREDGMEITRRYARLTFIAAGQFQKVRLFCIKKSFLWMHKNDLAFWKFRLQILLFTRQTVTTGTNMSWPVKRSADLEGDIILGESFTYTVQSELMTTCLQQPLL